jgi:hypothetical protein
MPNAPLSNMTYRIEYLGLNTLTGIVYTDVYRKNQRVGSVNYLGKLWNFTVRDGLNIDWLDEALALLHLEEKDYYDGYLSEINKGK